MNLVNLQNIIALVIVLESINEIVLLLSQSIHMCGVCAQLCPQPGFDTLSFLLMIIHEPLGYI